MYFRGKLTIDPSQMTKIQTVKPEGQFKQLFYNITRGKIGDKKEVETFKALSLIQQLYAAFSGMGINNLVRLNHDDIEIYFDQKGEKDDFKTAVDRYSIEIDSSMSSYFNTLWMVLEHEDETFKYLLEISVNRSHEVKEYPIEIIISGLLKDFRGNQNDEYLKQQLKQHFKSQREYDNFLQSKQKQFEGFTSKVIFELKKQIRIDDVRSTTRKRMTMQKEKPGRAAPADHRGYDGTPYQYYGFGDFIGMALLWSALTYDHGFHIADTEIMNEAGDMLGNIGENGIDAVSGSILDEAAPLTEGIENVGFEGVEEIKNAGFEDVASDSGSWFDGILDGDGFDFDIDI
jgi:hypothetical protein